MTQDARYQRELCSYLASFLTDHKRELLPRLLLNRTRHLTVVIEDLHKVHNTSACLRSCDCFGVQDVHIVENYNEYADNEEISLGASQWLTLTRYGESGQDNTTRCAQQLRERGYRIVMTSPHEPTCELSELDVSQPTALIFGNEKDGASETARELSDDVMRIPMYGFTESFNISVAVAVTLHHLVWQMRRMSDRWHLTTAERDELLMQWVRNSSGRKLPLLEEKFENEIWNADQPANETTLWPTWAEVSSEPVTERGSRHE